MMALVSTPAMFAVPTSINKGFNPPFVLRVGVVSTAPTQIKATVAAYVLQKDQASSSDVCCSACSHAFAWHACHPPRDTFVNMLSVRLWMFGLSSDLQAEHSPFCLPSAVFTWKFMGIAQLLGSTQGQG